jgi:hypothetical protein
MFSPLRICCSLEVSLFFFRGDSWLPVVFFLRNTLLSPIKISLPPSIIGIVRLLKGKTPTRSSFGSSAKGSISG